MDAAESGQVSVVKSLIEWKADVKMLTEVIMYIMYSTCILQTDYQF